MATECPIANTAGWPVVLLKDITTKIGSGATPRGGSESYLDTRGTFALVRSQNVFDRRFDREGLAYITDEQADALKGVILREGDVLLNITGDGITFARACMVPSDVLPACVNQHVSIIRVDPSTADPGYVLSFLTHNGVKPYIEAFNAGGSRRAITKGHIESFRLPLPALSEQRAIAHILGTLDDKIELNRRRNQTLEAMARAQFKDWFVDFGPVRAKVEGREPYLPADIWQLFSERLDDEGKPEGWGMGALGDVAEHPRRTIQPDKIEPNTPYIALEHMPKRCITLNDWGSADALESNKYAFRRGEILFGKLRPYFHKVGVAPVDGVCSTDIVVVTAKEKKWFGFVLCHVSSDEFVDYTNAGSTGTKMPRTSWNDMARYELMIPPSALVEAFNETIAPWVSQIIGGIHESRTLAQLRDTLLPKLISGELHIADAERFVEARV